MGHLVSLPRDKSSLELIFPVLFKLGAIKLAVPVVLIIVVVVVIVGIVNLQSLYNLFSLKKFRESKEPSRGSSMKYTFAVLQLCEKTYTTHLLTH